jgi:hypothetical protein
VNVECRIGCRILVPKLEGKHPALVKDNIKMDFREIGLYDMNWIYLPQNRD